MDRIMPIGLLFSMCVFGFVMWQLPEMTTNGRLLIAAGLIGFGLLWAAMEDFDNDDGEGEDS